MISRLKKTKEYKLAIEGVYIVYVRFEKKKGKGR
jgi:hypothetical protein